MNYVIARLRGGRLGGTRTCAVVAMRRADHFAKAFAEPVVCQQSSLRLGRGGPTRQPVTGG